MPQEGMLKVLALAKKERENGRQVMIVNMKKIKSSRKSSLQSRDIQRSQSATVILWTACKTVEQSEKKELR